MPFSIFHTDLRRQYAAAVVLALASAAAASFFVFQSSLVTQAAPETVNCSGTSGAPTAVDEASLAGDDVTFTDTGGDGYCQLDAALSAASVVIETGVTITHPLEDADGVTITTTGNFEIQSGAFINANEKGCRRSGLGDTGAGYGPDGTNTCSKGGTGAGSGASSQGGGGGGHGGRGGNGVSQAGGTFYDSPTNPVLFGASGGTATVVGSVFAGHGGGLILLDVGGVFTHNGSLSVNGGNAAGSTSDYGPGGGAGGSINITAGTFNGTTGTFSARGGNGQDGFSGKHGGGGGAGRIAIRFDAGSFAFDDADFDADGGLRGNTTAEDGGDGTAFVQDTNGGSAGIDADDDIQIFSGFTYDDTDYVVNSWTTDASATNQYCDTAATSPSITATTVLLSGIVSCNASATTTDFSVSSSGTVTLDALTFALSREKTFFMNGGGSVSLTGVTTVNANSEWTGLSDLTIASTATINANEKGCRAFSGGGNGFAPDGSNVCTQSATGSGIGNSSNGSGGGGHGGAGGAGTNLAGGGIYDSATNPVLFGASGGSVSATNIAGRGGGRIHLEISGLFSHEGSILADGQDAQGTVSNRGSGGGSGGTINVTVGSVDCAIGNFSATGGIGIEGFNNQDGGGGGGGRIAINYTSETTSGVCALDADADTIGGSDATIHAAGGLAGDNATDGSTGTLSINQQLSMSSAVTDDTDGDGQIDAIVVTFTEDLDGTTVAGADFSVTSPAFTVASASETAPGEVTILLTESGAPDTDATPTVNITNDDGGISNVGGGKTATSGSIISTDGADPRITSISPADGTTGVSSATDVVLTFSEPMDTGTVTVTVSGEPTGRTNAFSNGDETLTISYTGSFSSGDHVVTLTAGDDPAGNTNSGAVTGITHPATFAVASSGGGGSPTPPVGSGTPGLDITSPTEGTELEASSPIQISWTSQGRIDFVNLYYSIGGESWTSIVQNHPNSGLYDWTVPNHNTEALFLRIEGTDQTTVFVSNEEGPMSIIGATFEPPPPTEDGDVPVTVRGGQAFIRPNGCRYFATGVFFPSPKDGTLQPVNEICPGDRITTPSYRTVYLVNGLLIRHPFFNALMYRTHYADFTGVKVVTDSTLVTMDLGDLILPKPGTVLVKVPDRPETYALFVNSEDPIRPLARLVETEQAAVQNFGPDWADSVIDIPPTMFDLQVLRTPILGDENLDSSTLLRREDLEDPVSPFTFASLLGQAARILMQAAKAVVTGW